MGKNKEKKQRPAVIFFKGNEVGVPVDHYAGLTQGDWFICYSIGNESHLLPREKVDHIVFTDNDD